MKIKIRPGKASNSDHRDDQKETLILRLQGQRQLQFRNRPGDSELKKMNI